MSKPELRMRLLAILAADAAGYSRLMSIHERATVAALDAARDVFRQHIGTHGGRVVDMAGDSVLAVFENATGAMNAALAVQMDLAVLEPETPEDERMRFRIGIHVGDVIEKSDGTVYGDGVNIAARLEGLAFPSRIVVSQDVYSMVARRVEAVFEDIGEQRVKNIATPVRAFRVRHRLPGETASSESAGVAKAPLKHGNLPDALPTLFGRDEAMSELKALVGSHRVVSIVGSGGIGKTRLAQAAAHTLRDGFSDGGWMIQLAPVAEVATLPGAVAQALGVTLPGRKPAEDEVIDALRDRALLLVIDNCEHLIGAVSQFVECVLQRAPRVHVLATSQELLKVSGEHVYRLATLDVPTIPDLTAALHSAAVALFVDRVSALQPGFALSERNVVDVVEICRRLDGLPLAIELAAARVPLLGVMGVRERLHQRFRILTSGARVAMRRHQTLHEAIDWSYGLLSNDQRAVFRRAGVFAGSFNMSAAQQALVDDELDAWAVLEHLGTLVDKSLLVADTQEPPRYRLLESSRAYALEKLREAGETDATLRRHAQAVLALFELTEDQLWVARQTVFRDLCLPDIDNLRAALEFAAQSDAHLHIALAGASAWIWSGIGQHVEGLRRCAEALARVDAATPPDLEARLQLGWSALAEGSAGAAKLSAAERAVALYRELNDRLSLYLALSRLTITLALSGNPEAGEQLTLEMEQLLDASWPPTARLRLFFARAHVLLIGGRHEEGQAVVQEMMDLATDVRDSSWINEAKRALAELAAIRGDFEEAVAIGRGLISEARHERFADGVAAWHLGNTFSALTQLGQIDEALGIAREVVPIFARDDTLWLWLDSISLLAFKRGRIAGAGLALGRADAMNVWRGGRRELSGLRNRDEVMVLLNKALDNFELADLLTRGAAMSDEEVARIALAE